MELWVVMALNKCIDWVKFNLALCRRYLNMDGLLAIAIDPSYISKSGKKTPHIGTYGLECCVYGVHFLLGPNVNILRDTRRIPSLFLWRMSLSG